MRIRAATVLPPLLLGLLLALASSASAAGGDSEPPPRNPEYAEAVRLIDQGRFAEAVPLLQRVIAAEPGHADAHNLLGYSTRKLGRPQQALTHYREALRLQPDHRGAHEYIGETYLQLGQLDQAKEQLAWLDRDCWLPCGEYADLKEAIARYEDRHAR